MHDPMLYSPIFIISKKIHVFVRKKGDKVNYQISDQGP